MRKLWLALLLVVGFSAVAGAQTTTAISCTDSTNTNCTLKKNQPFSLTADPALVTDAIQTEKWRLYVDGAVVSEQPNQGAAPLFSFTSGMSAAGDHTIYMEAIGTAYDATGQPAEVASGPSNVITLHVVTGSLSAPKNVRIIK